MDPGEAPAPPDPPSLRATTSAPPPLRSRRSARVVAALAVVAVAIGAAGAWRIAGAEKEKKAAVSATAATLGQAVLARHAPAQVAAAPRADAELDRDGHSWCADGQLVVLPDFASADGAFDVVVHFHGTNEVVTQSLAAAKVNAVAVVFNLGTGSGVYETRFEFGPRFSEVLDLAQAALEKRHLANPHLRRVALSAFSAGFGGVLGLLERPDGVHAIDDFDAVLLFDGLHAGLDEHRAVDMRRVQPLVAFARAATRGEKLFYVTHSDIQTFEYASTHATADALLEELGVTRQDGGETPPMPDLAVFAGPAGKRELHLLVPKSHAEKAGFFVRGYAGERPESHLSHLHQMGATGFPELTKRWAAKPPR